MQLQIEKLEQEFSERLRRFRGDRSQAEFCRVLGLSSQATYARYEAGRIPAGDVLLQIANQLGITVDALLTGESRNGLTLQAEDPGVFHARGNGHLPLPNLVPLMGYAQGGTPIDLALTPEEHGQVPTDLRAQDAFAVTLRGDSMAPYFSEGDTIIVDPSQSPRPERLVVAQLKDEGACFKLLNYAPGKDLVRLSSYNPIYPPLDRHRRDFDFIHPVHAVIKHVGR